MAIVKHKNQRVGVFIDTQNLYHSARNLYGARVNFSAILKEAVAGRQLIRALAYVITTESGEEKNFLDALEKAGIETKAKPLQIFYGGAKKADWDVGIAIDAIKMAPKLDTVVVVSGDGDFIPLVEYLQMNEGCQVEIVAFGRSASGKLKEAADHFLDLDENPKKFLLGGNGHQREKR
ncbi:MAG: NYN domain-containing protein [bacterium]|nr:NYN domain-containing protein [bacterium]